MCQKPAIQKERPHLKGTSPFAYSSLIVSVTVLAKILFTGFTTDVAEAKITTRKMMSNSLTGIVHGVPKYEEMIVWKNFICKSKPRIPPVSIPEIA